MQAGINRFRRHPAATERTETRRADRITVPGNLAAPALADIHHAYPARHRRLQRLMQIGAKLPTP